jgi:hypothetical protein
MLEVLKLFQRDVEPPVDRDSTHLDPGDYTIAELQQELRAVVHGVFQRAGIDPAMVEVDARHMGHARSRPLFACMLRMAHWERQSGLRLLIGLPHIERATRRAIAGSWLAEATQFAGVWLHPATAVLESGALRELGALLTSVEQGQAAPALTESLWSLPPELRDPA